MYSSVTMVDIIKILVVEDNEDDFVLLEAFLESAEYDLTWCSSAEHARQQLSVTPFDLILLDHGLPDTNSLSFVRELSAQYATIPVIILTGMEDQTLAVSAIKQGAVNYILKDEIALHLLPAIADVFDDREIDKQPTLNSAEPRFIDSAEHIYKTILDTMTEGCVVVSRAGQITFVNTAVGQMLRKPAHHFLGQSIKNLFTKRSRQQVLKLVADQQCARSHDKAVMEGELLLPNGDAIPTRISARGLPENDTALLVLTDISAQVEARANLARLYQQASEQHSRLNAVIESSWDGVLFVTSSAEILTINGSALALLGLSREATLWVGSHLSRLTNALSAAWQPFVNETFEALQHPETTTLREGEGTFGEKEILWQMNSVMDQGKPIGFLVVLRDVTDVRSAESMRDDLTHALVHDLRSPLMTMLTSLELIQYMSQAGHNTLSAKQTRYVNGAIEGTQRLSKLVTGILDISKLESGEMPIELGAIDLTTLVSVVVSDHISLAESKHIALESHLSTTFPMILADYSLMRRVLQNLVDNALKFTPFGGRVVISAENHPAGIMLKVADSGTGIPSELRPRLFQRFSAGNQPGRGSGLGLAFCKLVVEAHGGQISVQSVTGEGSTFCIELPLTRASTIIS